MFWTVCLWIWAVSSVVYLMLTICFTVYVRDYANSLIKEGYKKKEVCSASKRMAYIITNLFYILCPILNTFLLIVIIARIDKHFEILREQTKMMFET